MPSLSLGADMQRREFITLIGGAAAAWSLAARAQQPAIPVIGYLSSASPGQFAPYTAAFISGLKEAGFVDGQNVAIEYRWAEGRYDQLPALAAELVGRHVTVIVATGSNAPAIAAKAATAKIPIVFLSGGDPVTDGLVASLNKPGGNVTGVSFVASALMAKRLGLLHQLVPKAALVGVLVNPTYPEAELQRQELQEGAGAISQKTFVVSATSESEIEAGFVALKQQGADALLVANDPFFVSRRGLIVSQAARHALPAIYFLHEFAEAGGLMSYGASLTNASRESGIYTGRILKGEKPAELPVSQPTKFEFVINLKTAKALGLEVPAQLLALADEVIE
jgi:putative tryptophan/tyrosine transport system substrate-binding protein